ncbi:MAG TPA: M10 family metallopeptidase C-terminal domain-containing protein [Allosphingosinicella sp.]
MAYVRPTVRSGNVDVDGLLMDFQWDRGSNLFFGFPVSVSQWTGYTAFNGTDNEPRSAIGLNSRQQTVAITALRQIEGLVAGLSFSRAPAEADADGRADIRFGTTNEILSAQAYTPYAVSSVNGQYVAGDVAGDVWFSYRYNDYANPIAGDYAYYTFLHEIGHAVGLNHPHDGEVYGTVSAKYDNMNYTVMTYRSYEGMGVEAPFHNEDFGYPQTYMLLDIAALQFMYGADFTFNGGDTTYTWFPEGGELFVNGTLTLDPGANKIFMTVWDGGGIDTYSFYRYFTAVKVDLEPGAWTITAAQQRADLGDGRSAIGNIANAWLYQGDTRSLIENVEGGSGDDVLLGNQAANTLRGNVGNDTLDGRTGADMMIGGAGSDTYYIDNIGDVAFEVTFEEDMDRVYVSLATYTLNDSIELMTGTGTGSQSLTGNAGNNVIVGNAAFANRLDGGGGADTLQSGFWDDTYLVDNIGDTIVDAGGNDTVLSSVSYVLREGLERLTLTGGNRINATGNQYINYLTGNDYENVLDGGGGDDVLEGKGSNDTYIVDSAGDQVIEAEGGGSDRVIASFNYTLGANVENLTLAGSTYAGTGNALANAIFGNAAANRIDGGAGVDRLMGGAGGDYYIVDSSGDIIVEDVNDVAGGPDIVEAWVGYILPDGVEMLVLQGTAALAGHGNGAANSLLGNDGANFLDGKGGADAMAGGMGDDTYIVDDLGDTVSEGSGAGLDTVLSSVSFALGFGVENLTLTGMAAINGTGNGDANLLIGNSGANRLDGGTGNDEMRGAFGDDVYDVRDIGDQVIEAADQGTDSVTVWLLGGAIYTMAANVENANIMFDAGVVGNALRNMITGGVGNNVIDGGAGGDRMVGGAGGDTYYVDQANDAVEEVNDPNDLPDTVIASISYALGDYVERLTLAGSAVSGTGNALDNVIEGNALANRIEGKGGADRLSGGGGADTFVYASFSDSTSGAIDRITDFQAGFDKIDLVALAGITLSFGQATDSATGLVYTVVSAAASASTLVLRVDGIVTRADVVADAPVGSAGNDILVGTEGADELNGEGGDDLLQGLGGNDVLLGGDGQDRLEGGTGQDRMTGGAGDDVYLVDDAGDMTVEAPGGGTDTIQSTISLALPDNVENLILLPFGANGTGNGLANRLIGNSSNNILDGGLGADTMEGGEADDIYYVDNAGDQVVDSGGAFDQVYASVSFTLTDGIEYLWLTGSAPVNGTGNAQSNRIIGNAGANILDGGGSADTLDGGLGDDRYIVDNEGDSAFENDGAGTDSVVSSVAWTLGFAFENLVLTGAGSGIGNGLANVIEASGLGNRLEGLDGADTLNGGAAADTLLGGNGVDVLTGAGGADVLTGGADADSLNGGTGADRFVYLAFSDSTAASRDWITGFEVGLDKIDLLALGRITVALTQASELGVAYTIVEARSAQGTLTLRADGVLALADFLFNNALFGTPESERIDGTAADDEIRGNGGYDELYGLGGNDLLIGGANDDTLDGGTGRDVMRGGAGTDLYHVDQADDVVEELAGEGDHDLVFTSLASYTLGAQVERLFGTSDAGQVLTGNASANRLYAGAGNDTLHGLGGNDQIEGNGGNDILFGGDGADGMWGNDGDDTIEGGAGQDSLSGGAGNDILRGEQGDQVFGNDGNDLVELRGGTSLADSPKTEGYLGTGFDRLVLDYSGFTQSLILFAGGPVDRSEASIYLNAVNNLFANEILRIHDVDGLSITTGSGNDFIEARGAGDTVSTGAGNDTIAMDGAGSRWNFIGALKADAGSGIDRARINWSDLLGNQAVVWDSAVAASATIGSGDAERYLRGVEILERFESGAGDDRFTLRAVGSAASQTVNTNAGNDIVTVIVGTNQSETGTYSLDLGAGTGDSLILDFSASSQAINNRTGAWTMGGAHLLIGTNYEKLTVTGSAQADVLVGAEAVFDARLSGGGGDDVLGARFGTTVADGGTGNDRLEVSFDGANNNLSLVVATTAGAAGGFDGSFVGPNSAVSYSSIEHFTITGGNGSDTITTRGGNDILSGGAGTDQLNGGAGDDIYYVDISSDTVTEVSGGGFDEVRVLGSNYTLAANVYVEKLTGLLSSGQSLTGNNLGNILNGAGGDDILNGGTGSDFLTGGLGNDTYYVDETGDVVTELANEGTDRVYAAQSAYTLGANVEQLFSFGATAAQTLNGNSLANLISGSAFGDVLDGREGADSMVGGLGNDIYLIDNIGDVAEEQAGQGTDEARTALAAYSLGANLERLVSFNATAGQALTGNALANTLVGSAFGDVLDGGAGNDVLEGGLGNDVYLVDSLADVVTESAGAGTDEVRTSVGSRSDFAQMYTLAANVENLTGTSATGQGVYGNALSNVIAMGAGGDLVVLDGGGNDLVSGGGGDDFLYWGAAFSSADKADGGAGFDTVGLLGNYALAFDADDLVSIEKLAVYSSGNAAAPNSYSLTMHDANVAAGQKLMVVAQSLLAGEAFTFNGAAEIDGRFNVRGGRGGDSITGGAGADTLYGGLGADTLRGGAGNDEFEYRSAAESTAASRDTILDFARGDRINLAPIDADGNAANGDSKFTWLGSGAFSGQAGQLRVSQQSGIWVVEADTNGDSAADLVIHFTAPPGFLPEKSDFYI